ncbi:hypothetical protein ACH47V_25815 [Micromonospora chersina]|uniref:hypothetical protein n=1 Tax=Micromonospora chersina TaxID=47854 RepID=UPI003405225D
MPDFIEIMSDVAGVRGALQSFWPLSISNLADGPGPGTPDALTKQFLAYKVSL